MPAIDSDEKIGIILILFVVLFIPSFIGVLRLHDISALLKIIKYDFRSVYGSYKIRTF